MKFEKYEDAKMFDHVIRAINRNVVQDWEATNLPAGVTLADHRRLYGKRSRLRKAVKAFGCVVVMTAFLFSLYWGLMPTRHPLAQIAAWLLPVSALAFLWIKVDAKMRARADTHLEPLNRFLEFKQSFLDPDCLLFNLERTREQIAETADLRLVSAAVTVLMAEKNCRILVSDPGASMKTIANMGAEAVHARADYERYLREAKALGLPTANRSQSHFDRAKARIERK